MSETATLPGGVAASASPVLAYLEGSARAARAAARRQRRDVHPRARPRRPRWFRDVHRRERRLRVRDRRQPPAVHVAVDVEAVRLRSRARGSRQTRRPEAHRRRADRRRVQRDQSRAQHRAAVQPDDQRGRDRVHVARARSLGRGSLATDPEPVRRVRRTVADAGRGRVPVGDRQRPSQPRDRTHAAQLRDSRHGRRPGARPVFPSMLDPGDVPRREPHGGDARDRRHQPADRRARDLGRARRRSAEPHDDVRDVRLRR